VLHDVWHQEQEFLIARGRFVQHGIVDMLVKLMQQRSHAPFSEHQHVEDIGGVLKNIDKAAAAAAKKKSKADDANVIGVARTEAAAGRQLLTVSFHDHALKRITPAVVTLVLNALAVRATQLGRRELKLQLTRPGDDPLVGRCTVVVDVVPPLVTLPQAPSPTAVVKVQMGKRGTATPFLDGVVVNTPAAGVLNGFVELFMPPGTAPIPGEYLSLASSVAVTTGDGRKKATRVFAVEQYDHEVYVDGLYCARIAKARPMHIKLEFEWCSTVDGAVLTALLRSARYTCPNATKEKLWRPVEVIVSEGIAPGTQGTPSVLHMSLGVDADSKKVEE
jgi:hypothetical protein